MEAGAKVTLTRTVRSAKTGMLLPREGTLICITQNLGRTLLLVEFEGGQNEYLFENEVELKDGTSHEEYVAVGDGHFIGPIATNSQRGIA
jgi:hypothetical protein